MKKIRSSTVSTSRPTTPEHMSTHISLNELATSLASDPQLTRLALAAAWHPDLTDKEHAELKRQIRRAVDSLPE